MCHNRCLQILLLLLSLFSFALLSVNGMPWGGPSSNNRGSSGGPAWNGGTEDPRYIIIHSGVDGKSHHGSHGSRY